MSKRKLVPGTQGHASAEIYYYNSSDQQKGAAAQESLKV